MYSDIKQAAYEANMLIPANHLALYTWGNVSAFDKDKGVFAIKPSGVPYPELTPVSISYSRNFRRQKNSRSFQKSAIRLRQRTVNSKTYWVTMFQRVIVFMQQK